MLHAIRTDAPRAVLRRYFGYSDFRQGQAEIITSVMSGRDTLAVLPTGGGKSICYQVPALLLPGITVVLSPLISLMLDQVESLERRGIAAACLNSTMTREEISAQLARLRSGGLRILYAAPERFAHGHLAQLLRSAGVSLLAVDEAHCISEWGHDFRPSYLRVHNIREALGEPPVIALTATATPRVRGDIARFLRLRNPRVIVTGFDRGNLTYGVYPIRKRGDRERILVQTVRHCRDTMIVYASTRRSVERVTALLGRMGLPVGAYHAGMSQRRREYSRERFMAGHTRILVATNAFGMGIDKPDVRLVLHHSVPGTLEAYYQEAGRAGRDGKPARCLLLYHYGDRFTHEFFITARIPRLQTVDFVLQQLQRNRDASGLVPWTWPDSAAARSSDATTQEVRVCLDLLVNARVIHLAPPLPDMVDVRLLARRERIGRELTTPARSAELRTLRVLWRIHGSALNDGARLNLTEPSLLQSPADTLRQLRRLQQDRFIVTSPVAQGWRLPGRTDLAAASALKDSLEYRRSVEFEKLRQMQSYAATRGCRRTFLLRYFGETYPGKNCGGCDNCLRGAGGGGAPPIRRALRALQRQLRLD